jgi:hypothetical protein
MFLVNETMVEWVNNEIYKRGFDTSLYYVRSYDEYEWGWIVNIDNELPPLSIEYINYHLSGTLYVHRNGFILGEWSIFDYSVCGDFFSKYSEEEMFCHIATTDDWYNWKESNIYNSFKETEL